MLVDEPPTLLQNLFFWFSDSFYKIYDCDNERSRSDNERSRGGEEVSEIFHFACMLGRVCDFFTQHPKLRPCCCLRKADLDFHATTPVAAPAWLSTGTRWQLGPSS